MSQASGSFDPTPSEIGGWVEDAKRRIENSLRANPLDIREQYEKQLRDLQDAYGEAMLELRARKVAGPVEYAGRELSRRIWPAPSDGPVQVLGSGLVLTQSQKMTVAASVISEKKVFGHRS